LIKPEFRGDPVSATHCGGAIDGRHEARP
jgi:hypothetical protein